MLERATKRKLLRDHILSYTPLSHHSSVRVLLLVQQVWYGMVWYGNNKAEEDLDY